MKNLVLVSALMMSTSAFAANYNCKGVNQNTKKLAEIDLMEVTSKKLVVVNPDGDEITLERSIRRNESELKYAVYSDDSYDGYGGFIKVSVPKEVAAAGATMPFVAYYLASTYSEAGKVAEVNVKANCVSAN